MDRPTSLGRACQIVTALDKLAMCPGAYSTRPKAVILNAQWLPYEPGTRRSIHRDKPMYYSGQTAVAKPDDHGAANVYGLGPTPAQLDAEELTQAES